MSFDRAFASTMQSEGGYSNHPKDSGGETYMGVARNHHPHWQGWAIIDECRADGEALSLAPGLTDAVRQFYKEEFWVKMRCPMIDQVSEAVAEELFEAGVNCGPGNAVRFLQRALNRLNNHGKLWADVQDDGGMGPKTMQAVLTCITHRPPRILVKCQNGEQYIFYTEWAKHEDFPGVFERTGA